MTTKTIKVSSGHYRKGEWTILKTEETDPGYRWNAQHPDKEEIYARTKAELLKMLY